MKRFLEIFLPGLLCIAAAFLYGIIFSLGKTEIKLDFCRNIIKYSDGYAGINESDNTTSIFRTDSNGKLNGNIKTFNTNYALMSVNSYDCIFTDENGELYVICTTYNNKSNKKVQKTVYQCDFGFEILNKAWKISFSENDYSWISGCIPTVKNDRLYYSLCSAEGGKIVTFAADKFGNNVEVSSSEISGDFDIEKSIYTESGTVLFSSMYGIWLDDKCIYPQSSQENVLLNGLNFDEGYICFADIFEKKLVKVSLLNENISFSRINENVNLNQFQNMRVYSDGSFTASAENKGYLYGAEYKNGITSDFRELKGNIRLKTFIAAVLGAIAAEAVICIIIRCIFVRFKKLKKDKKEKKTVYIRISSRISIISIFIMTIGILNISRIVYNNISRFYNEKVVSDNISSAQYMASYLSLNGIVEINNGAARFDKSFYTTLCSELDNYSYCDYVIFVQSNDELYCVYSNEFTAEMPAEYAASIRAVNYCRESIDTQSIISFEDYRTIGKLNYAFVPLEITDANGIIYKAAASSVTDSYNIKISKMNVMIKIIGIIFIVSLFLIIFSNLILRIVLHKLKKLKHSIDIYSNSREYQEIKIKGGDEIAVTADAIDSMAKGIDIYLSDINRCNKNYAMLIPYSVFDLLGNSGITSAKAGEFVNTQLTLAQIVFRKSANMEKITGKIIDYARLFSGIILDFNAEYVNVCFKETTVMPCKFCEKIISNEDISECAVLFLYTANAQAGIAGNEKNKKLLVIMEEYNKIEYIKNLPVSYESLCVITDNDYESFKSLKNYKMRMLACKDGVKYYELLLINRNVPNSKLFHKKTFEKGVSEYNKGNYHRAKKYFRRITEYDPDDKPAAYYLINCIKREEC